ncbi:hypothetical protein BT69DRAFT_1108134 [Atractiella rhizophila]|nr:hypothetical protein BT69DRAFT_1108134 [Atractiella rhizophila]
MHIPQQNQKSVRFPISAPTIYVNISVCFVSDSLWSTIKLNLTGDNGSSGERTSARSLKRGRDLFSLCEKTETYDIKDEFRSKM